MYRLKNHVFRMAALFTVASFLSCNDGEEGSSGVMPLHIISASAGITTTVTRSAVTRASGTKTLTGEGDAIGIFLKADANYGAVNNCKYTYQSSLSGWGPAAKELTLGVKTAWLSAYYPYKEEQALPAVVLATRAYKAEHEFYYQTFNASYLVSAVNLNLKRAYALIRFSLIRGEADVPATGDSAYPDAGNVTAFGFTANLLPSGQLNLLDNVLTGTISRITVNNEAPEVPFTIGNRTVPAQKDFLIVPTTGYSGELTFTATVDGKAMSGKVTEQSLCGTEGKLRAGVMYEIKVTVRPKALTVSGISREAWDVTDIPGELEIK